MTERLDDVQKVSYLMDEIKNNLDRLGLSWENFNREQAFKEAYKMSLPQYRRIIALLYSKNFSELKIFLKQLNLINISD